MCYMCVSWRGYNLYFIEQPCVVEWTLNEPWYLEVVSVRVCMSVYHRVSMEDDLPHEISIKHSFSYNWEPCEKVTQTQSPQLPRHLSRTEKKKGVNCKSRHFLSNVMCCSATVTYEKTHKYSRHFQCSSPSSWITRAVEQLYPCLVLPHCWSPQMRDCWLTAATPACLNAAGGRSDHSGCVRWWLAEGSKVGPVAVDSAEIPLFHSRRK